MSARRGVLILVLALGALGVAVLFAAIRLRGPAATTAWALVLDVPSTMGESEPPERPLSLSVARYGRLTLYALVNALDHAAADDRVGALVLHVDDLSWGWAKIAEVRDALARFRAAGKPVLASLRSAGEAEYLLASSATVVSLHPTATLQLDGLALSVVFLRGTLDKAGIRPNYTHVGRYKSGVESMTRTGFSVPAREALEAVLDDQFGLLVDSLSSARGTSPESMRRAIDAGPFGALEALERGLVDTLLYESEVDSLAARFDGRRLAPLSFPRYLERMKREARTLNRVALITATGTILPGRSRIALHGEWILGAETMIRALEQARTRRSIRAVLLRIDSPGGDAGASDEIWREVARCREAKPVIASFSDYAASGGYYIAMGADSIVCQPGTLTGSIGIYGGKMNVAGLLGKLGLSVETVSRGRNARMLSRYSDFTEVEARLFERQLETYYRRFVAKVAENRGMSAAAVESLAAGRVWSGLAARERGLVDGLGGYETAFAMVRSRAGLPADAPLAIERLPHARPSFLQQLIESLFTDADESALETAAFAETLGALLSAARFPPGAALALLPFTITIR